MKSLESILKKLNELRENGSVPSSFLEKPAYFNELLDEMLRRGIVEHAPARKGQWRYRLVNQRLLDKMIERFSRKTPLTRELDKVQATRITGNAHDATESKFPSIPVRATNAGAKISSANFSIDAYAICRYGIALYLPFNPEINKWRFNGSLCLVENQRVFWEAEKIINADFFLYLQGSFSNQIAESLKQASNDKPCIYFGDYDPAGLKMFLRLKKYVPHCRLFIPDNFEELLEKHGNKTDLAKQHGDFAKLLEADDEAVRRIRLAFEKTGKTLQQEALLIRA